MENNFLLESLAAYQHANSNLVMNVMVNTAFVNYIDQFNLTETLLFPILTNKTTSKHTLPFFLNDMRFDKNLLSALKHSTIIFHNISRRMKFLI